MKNAIVVSALLTWGILSATNSWAAPDVSSGGQYATRYPEYIRVTPHPDQTVSFELCQSHQDSFCKKLGNRDSYAVRDLQRKSELLKRDAHKMIGADALFLVASGLVGTIATLASPTPVGPAVIAIYAASGMAGGSVFVMRSYLYPDSNTPMSKLRNARAISNKIILGESVTVNEPVTEFAARLDEVLKGIM